jgi:hypothetical protein
MNKHIAMWSCPRSRSTLIFRSFDQRDDCTTHDEPFYPPYLLNNGLDHPYRDEIVATKETNYHNVIDRITADLPTGISFSFQKHIAKNILPEYGREWLKNMTHVFLIRPADEVIASYYDINKKADSHDTGFIELKNIFDEVSALSSKPPIVIDSNHLLEDPEANLRLLCSKLEIDFSEKMLRWKAGIEGSNILVDDLSNPANVWHSSLMHSTGFQPYQKKEITLPLELNALEQECNLIYQ